jgi:hypothetical protein
MHFDPVHVSNRRTVIVPAVLHSAQDLWSHVRLNPHLHRNKIQLQKYREIPTHGWKKLANLPQNYKEIICQKPLNLPKQNLKRIRIGSHSKWQIWDFFPEWIRNQFVCYFKYTDILLLTLLYYLLNDSFVISDLSGNAIFSHIIS